MTAPSLDGRRFAAVANVGGEVTADTVFEYHEQGGEVWAAYRGGAVVRGFLVGTRAADTLEIRYVQLNNDGETSSGHCVSTIQVLPDGRLRLEEKWEWESRPGGGTSSPHSGDPAVEALYPHGMGSGATPPAPPRGCTRRPAAARSTVSRLNAYREPINTTGTGPPPRS
jgi:hypothetical protein